MVGNFVFFVISLALVIKGATLATKYSAKLAESYHLSKYIVGFIIVAFISILPETLISINAAIAGIPSFGLGTLLGSNVADLTLIFAILIVATGRGIKIESKILKNINTYPLFLVLPLVLGLNGYFSRIDGIILIVAGAFFYYMVFKNGVESSATLHNGNGKVKCFLFLLLAMALLLVGSHFTVRSATALAHSLDISPILIGMLVVSLGTTMPELFFSLKSHKQKDDGLAIGDILGSVLADATIVIGILACISPFYFPVKIIYITGVFMVIASIILLQFMRSGRILSKKEGSLLFVFWACYVIIEFTLNR
jgi:cation:H+ antiporter